MRECAVNYFKQGYSCSESIVKAACDKGLCDISLLCVATPFSGGISSGCLCGAVAGAQLVIGYNFGKNNSFDNDVCARLVAKEFMDRFKKIHKVTCCRILSSGFEFASAERKANCTNLVADCAMILEDLIKVKTNA